MIAFAETIFAQVQQWLFESVVQPIMFATGLMTFAEQAFDACEWFLWGVVEIALLATVFKVLERRYPVEPVLDRATIRTDFFYTILHRLGGFSLLAFALLTPVADEIEGALRMAGMPKLNLDQIWPGVTDTPWASFLMYLIVLDFADYWMHRAQHRWNLWWALHATHHAQRQMTFWSDNRNHLLDDLIRDALLALLALMIGIAPGQFILLTVASRSIQSLQHANLRWHFGSIGERLLVSPSFHRLHHAIGYGHEGPAKGCNFAVLFPVWDLIFRTADFRPGFVPTGIRDQLQGRDYGDGFWAQQRLGLARLFHREKSVP